MKKPIECQWNTNTRKDKSKESNGVSLMQHGINDKYQGFIQYAIHKLWKRNLPILKSNVETTFYLFRHHGTVYNMMVVLLN